MEYSEKESTLRNEGLEKNSATSDEAHDIVAQQLPVLEHDGSTMHPQPTSDPLDPLNWSSIRKHGILAVVMALYFMFTAITTITVPSFPQLQTQYNASLGQINWTVAIPALGLAVGV